MDGPENEWKGFFLARSCSSFPLDSAVLPSALAPPRRIQNEFLWFFVTVTAFLTALVRLTRPKARVTHVNSSNSLAVGLT